MSAQDNAIQTILDKIAFVATALSSTTVSVAWWATNWFDFGPELAKYVGSKIVNWWRKRSQVEDAKKLIGSLKEKLLLDSEQIGMIEQLVDLVRANDEELRKQIATDKLLDDICVEFLTKMDFDPKKARNAVSAIVEALREVLSVSVSPIDMYREQMVTRRNSQEILKVQKKIVSDIANIGIMIPSSFTPLERKLDCDIVLDSFEQYFSGRDTVLPQPQFFRRPHLNWSDLMEDFVYTRDDVISEIEDNFRKSNMQLVLGDSGAGKTTLAYIVGHRRLTAFRGSRCAIYFVDFLTCNPETIQNDIRLILESISGLRRINNHAVSRVLFIFDNIHLKPKWVNPIYEKMRQSRLSESEEEIVVDFLFLARLTKANKTKSSEDVILGVVGTHSARGLLQTIILEESQFNKTVSGICETYLKSILSQEETDLDLLAGKVSRKSKWSLWLVSFVLEGIEKRRQKIGFLPTDLRDISICDSFIRYYDDQLIRLEESQEYLKLTRTFLRRDEASKAYWSLMVLLSIFNRVDFSVPEILVHKILASLKDFEYDKEFLNLIRDMLIDRGEIVRSDYDSGLSFPHRTLGEQMYKCAQEDRCRSVPGKIPIATSLLQYRMDDWSELLLNYGITTSQIGRVIQGFLRAASIEEGHRLTNWLYDREDLLLNIISEDFLTFSLFIDRTIWQDERSTIELIKKVLSLNTIPLYYVSVLDEFRTGYPFFENIEIREIFFDRLRTNEELLDTLDGVSFLDIKDDDEFLTIIVNRIQDIVVQLEETTKPSDVIDGLSRFPSITIIPELYEAAISRIPDLVKLLRSEEDAPRVISQLDSWPNLLEHGSLKLEVLKHCKKLAELILAEQWWVVRLVGRVSYFRKEEAILQSIYEMLRTSEMILRGFSFAFECEEFEKNDEIQEILEMRIQDIARIIKNDELDEVFWGIPVIEKIAHKEEIVKALTSRIPDFLDCLSTVDHDATTVYLIRGIARLLESDELDEAVLKKIHSIKEIRTHKRNDNDS